MPKIVNKNERMDLILEKALIVFSRVGYREANLSLIADECGFSRPTVYQYFKDKNEIYYYAVKKVTLSLFARYSTIAFENSDKSSLTRLKEIVDDIFSFAFKNESAVENLVEFVLSERKAGVDVYSVLSNRTKKMRILLKRLILRGKNDNEIREEVDPEKMSDILYSIISSSLFEVGFFSRSIEEDIYKPIANLIDSLKK